MRPENLINRALRYLDMAKKEKDPAMKQSRLNTVEICLLVFKRQEALKRQENKKKKVRT